jgi:hypothetical protein
MKVLPAAILASLFAIAAAPAIAGTQTGFVNYLSARDSDGVILVYLSGSATNHPACALEAYWIIPNETTDSGKRLYSMLLSAQLGGRSVMIEGKDTCTRWPDGEDINTVLVKAAE